MFQRNNEHLDKVTETIDREKVINVEADILDPITWCEVCVCDYEPETLKNTKQRFTTKTCIKNVLSVTMQLTMTPKL